ncbi:MAG TPA: sigma-70 family RNA polymerase sigma factor [Pirellulales bacterium]|nr:sigma-70 family RNA polymerase sigma factor [Pirellulales bacterium]
MDFATAWADRHNQGIMAKASGMVKGLSRHERLSCKLTALYESLRDYRPDRAAFTTFLFHVTRAKCRTVLRQSRRQTLRCHLSYGLETDSEAVAKWSLSKWRRADDDLRLFVREALGMISPAAREIINLTFWQGNSLSGLAGVLGCSKSTARDRLRAALDRLRPLLRDCHVA